ncbi:hypothetical protein QCA50_007826 [Cerrena zonata]|uniref:Uncharacterized protein n=1 Tax=Cerrena zonata TaxID=2478898 RepID=A0AAW0GDB0_9APHY
MPHLLLPLCLPHPNVPEDVSPLPYPLRNSISPIPLPCPDTSPNPLTSDFRYRAAAGSRPFTLGIRPPSSRVDNGLFGLKGLPYLIRITIFTISLPPPDTAPKSLTSDFRSGAAAASRPFTLGIRPLSSRVDNGLLGLKGLPLTQRDCMPMTIEHDQEELGSKNKITSWIWRDNTYRKDPNVWQREATHIEWFRSSARATRWKEEVDLLEEEMQRTQRFLLHFCNHWEVQSQAVAGDYSQRGRAAFAARQASIFKRLLSNARESFPTTMHIDISTDSSSQVQEGGIEASSSGPVASS